jgi:hypothetical protein
LSANPQAGARDQGAGTFNRHCALPTCAPSVVPSFIASVVAIFRRLASGCGNSNWADGLTVADLAPRAPQNVTKP